MAPLVFADLACSLGLFPLEPLGRDPLVRARRHRRQYALRPGARVAGRAGLVRSAPISRRSAGRHLDPLVAIGRPADRGPDPAAATDARLHASGAMGLRAGTPARFRGGALWHDAHCSAPGPSLGLSAGGGDPGRRGCYHADVDAASHRSSRVAARHPDHGGSGHGRSEAAPGEGSPPASPPRSHSRSGWSSCPTWPSPARWSGCGG